MKRPTFYNASYDKMIKDVIAEGFPIVHFCKISGLSRSTIYQWRKWHPSFDRAIVEGLYIQAKKAREILNAAKKT